MKKIFLSVLLGLGVIFAACSNGEDTENYKEYYDIFAESKQIFAVDEIAEYYCVGTQYYQEEPIQIWTEIRSGFGEDGTFKSERDFYIHRVDGSKELLLANVEDENISIYSYWLDDEGRLFSLDAEGISALDENGNELFYTVTGESVDDICRLADGRYMLILRFEGQIRLAELNITTGEIDVLETVAISGGSSYIAPIEEGLMIVNGEGIKKVSLENGQKEDVLVWSGSSYSWAWERVGDFRQNTDGSIDLLYLNGKEETLKRERITEGKIVITVRATGFSKWFKEQIVAFNRTSPEYYVVLEERAWDVDSKTFCEKTDVEMAAGKGADIIFYNATNDYYSLMRKEAFVNLQPYIKKVKLEKSDYFSGTFLPGEDEDDIYGVNLLMHISSTWVDEGLTQSMEDINVELLLEALQMYQGKAVLAEGWSSPQVLSFFLQGSEDLWGMIDWKQKRCSFDGALFADMVDVAARYGDSANNGYAALAGPLARYDFYQCAYEDLDLEVEGNREIGFFFDDGNYSRQVFSEMVAINDNSKHKDGAWEVVQFLLGREAQDAFGSDGLSLGFPVNKQSYYKIEAELLKMAAEDEMGWVPFTEPQMERLEVEIENAEPFPIKTGPILDIIYEETSEYFSGVKSLEEVIDVIENRVQLYLDEIS